ncbi:uracil-DNA glycosylase [Thiorhodococcus minor]|uniref:Type-4 uracil-DNA glycosylase n=1 Tax=Thiorhodococcus minor TaxID=57489 RepID=A0A6M0K088_9GAMM|nr:uracil-DNA glycosylase [Thiorhodococcus minor]NEV62007.1 uracil-DNA glycosylase [Thiorhodococcus minor]
MEEWRRRAYLEAMGIGVWELREREACGGMDAEEGVSEREPAVAAMQDVSAELDPGETEPAETEPTASLATASLEAQAPPEHAMRSEIPRDEPAPRDARLESEAFDALLSMDDWELERFDVGAADFSPRDPSANAASNDVAQMDWAALEDAVATCRACGLCETRTQTVFGVGDRHAELMIVGEAPGADEDRAGEPFVGRAGQLLTRMLAAIGFAREQVYIANVLKCRPPGNRDPKPEEALSCEPFLLRQMALIRPKLILSVGRVSAQHLLRTDTNLGRLRGRWLDFGEHGIPLRVTYHPAYLLRSPEQKAKAWEDLTEVRRRLDARSPSGPPASS